jgi:hypothetical protein
VRDPAQRFGSLEQGNGSAEPRLPPRLIRPSGSAEPQPPPRLIRPSGFDDTSFLRNHNTIGQPSQLPISMPAQSNVASTQHQVYAPASEGINPAAPVPQYALTTSSNIPIHVLLERMQVTTFQLHESLLAEAAVPASSLDDARPMMSSVSGFEAKVQSLPLNAINDAQNRAQTSNASKVLTEAAGSIPADQENSPSLKDESEVITGATGADSLNSASSAINMQADITDTRYSDVRSQSDVSLVCNPGNSSSDTGEAVSAQNLDTIQGIPSLQDFNTRQGIPHPYGLLETKECEVCQAEVNRVCD